MRKVNLPATRFFVLLWYPKRVLANVIADYELVHNVLHAQLISKFAVHVQHHDCLSAEESVDHK